jgi:predicted peptidase
MIDRWICDRAADDFSGEYQPTDAITDRLSLNPDADNLAVIFPPWHGGSPMVDVLARRRALAHSVLSYKFHDAILNPDVESVKLSFEAIAERVSSDLYEFQDQMKYQRIHFIGLSLGNVALAKTAAKFPYFSGATMLTAGNSLADGLWEGSRTQGLRRLFEEKGLTEKSLRGYWRDLAPASHTESFAGKRVNAIVSRNDRIIPSYQQIEMVKRLQYSEADVIERYTDLGHVAALTSFCIKG